jgi:hypothetical protein
VSQYTNQQKDWDVVGIKLFRHIKEPIKNKRLWRKESIFSDSAPRTAQQKSPWKSWENLPILQGTSVNQGCSSSRWIHSQKIWIFCITSAMRVKILGLGAASVLWSALCINDESWINLTEHIEKTSCAGCTLLHIIYPSGARDRSAGVGTRGSKSEECRERDPPQKACTMPDATQRLSTQAPAPWAYSIKIYPTASHTHIHFDHIFATSVTFEPHRDWIRIVRVHAAHVGQMLISYNLISFIIYKHSLTARRAHISAARISFWNPQGGRTHRERDPLEICMSGKLWQTHCVFAVRAEQK